MVLLLGLAGCTAVDRSPAPTAAVLLPTTSAGAATPSVAPQSTPAAAVDMGVTCQVARGAPAIEPGRGAPATEPGTILFGPVEDGVVAPGPGYPLSFSIDLQLGYDALFDHSAGADEVKVVLARRDGADWLPVWSCSQAIAPGATGILGTLPKFEAPGVYRVDILAGDEVIASSLMSMVPPCVGVCSGG